MTEEQKKKVIEDYLNEYTKDAEKTVNQPDKLEKLLRDLEKKLSSIPALGGPLSNIPTLVSLIRSYIKHDYTDIPSGSIAAIVGALVYFLAPFDLVPDAIPGIGFVDDAAVIATCLALVGSDIEKYRQWRDHSDEQ
ncbi:MAG: DUF1232 domain-containing protein [Clostridia bacterium]|nr:DUF1232 domain-containing protein [Clostridia bacterium]